MPENNISVMNAEGSGLTQLTFNNSGKAGSFDPCCSPDGKKILFVRSPAAGGTDLFTMKPDGSDVARVRRTPGLELAPEWAIEH